MNVPHTFAMVRDQGSFSAKFMHPRFTFICATSAFICVFTALWPTPSTAAEISLRDDLDRQVLLKQPARRIITLAPFLTELVFSAGAGDRIVAVSAYSDYPPEAKALPQVGTAVSFSLERIAALEPDLVLVWRDSVRPEDIERITRFGAAVFVASARRLADVPRLLGVIGRLTGRDTAAVAGDYERALAGLKREHAGKRRLSAFLEIWNRPLTTISGEHFINEALAICGATNVFADLEGVAPVVPWETLYARDPEVIVGAGSAADAGAFRANWRARGTLAAVKSGRLLFLAADTIQRPTVRTPEGIAGLCAGLDRFR